MHGNLIASHQQLQVSRLSCLCALCTSVISEEDDTCYEYRFCDNLTVNRQQLQVSRLSCLCALLK
jgi:hypothetical protein